MKNSKSTRRAFLSTSIKTGAMLPFLGAPMLSFGSETKDNKSVFEDKLVHPLNILILGGTSFLGPHQIAYAMNRGHSISIFTRGKTKSTIHKKLYKEVEHLVGDRADNLEALKGRKWDAVIDNSGRQVQWTKDTAELLEPNVGLYLYTSSTGVYYPYLGKDTPEKTELVRAVPENTNEEEQMEYGYGVMKANSELAAKKAFGENRTIILRPTYMIGPADRFNRFIHWPVRLSQEGEIVVPGKSKDPVQYIDVRDVAAWMIRLIEKKVAGTFNAVGPAHSTGMHAFVFGAHAAFSSDASFVMIDDYEFLKTQKIPYLIPWIMPTGNNAGSALINNKLAKTNGLTFTPLAQTIRETYEWWHSEAVPEERRNKFMNNPKSLISREKEIIEAWKKK